MITWITHSTMNEIQPSVDRPRKLFASRVSADGASAMIMMRSTTDAR
jgi:hypothetical protein